MQDSSSSPAPAIRVQNLTKRYKKAKENAVDGISFEVAEGEFFAFLGPNGAGKTTTISILTTTLLPTAGSVQIAGYDLATESGKLREQVGVIFQNPSLDGNLTAEENIRLHCAFYGIYGFRPLYGMMPESYKKRVQELVSLVDLQDQLFSLVRTFSGGMKRKLEIIRSLFHKPKVLFLDEPTSGLDPLSRRNVWEYIRHVRETEKTTIFLTTHYLDEAEDAERVAIIHKGKIVLMGTPNEVKRKLVGEYLLLDADPRDSLLQELKTLGAEYEVTDRVRVTLHDRDAQRIVQNLKTPLSHLEIVYPTLEEAYLKLLEHQSQPTVS